MYIYKMKYTASCLYGTPLTYSGIITEYVALAQTLSIRTEKCIVQMLYNQ